MSSLKALHARCTKWRCHQDHTSLESSREESFLASSHFWWCGSSWCFLTCGRITPASASIASSSRAFLPVVCSVFTSKSSFLRVTAVMASKAHLTQCDLDVFFPVLLKCHWYTALYKFKVYQMRWLNIYCKVITMVSLADILS